MFLIPVVCCVSCSSGTSYNPVHGKVLYKNEPIEGVLVTFHPKQKKALTDLPTGQTGEDGAFTLMTGKGEGAPEGEYVVTFYCLQEAPEKKKAKPRGMVMQKLDLEDRFKGAYAKEEKSNFTVVIKSGKNELEPFNLK